MISLSQKKQTEMLMAQCRDTVNRVSSRLFCLFYIGIYIRNDIGLLTFNHATTISNS